MTPATELRYYDEGRACDSVLCSHPNCWAPKQRLSWGESRVVVVAKKSDDRRSGLAGAAAGAAAAWMADPPEAPPWGSARLSRSATSLSGPAKGPVGTEGTAPSSPPRTRRAAPTRDDTLTSEASSGSDAFGFGAGFRSAGAGKSGVDATGWRRASTSAPTTGKASTARGTKINTRPSLVYSRGTTMSGAASRDAASRQAASRSTASPAAPLTIVNVAEVAEDESPGFPMEVRFSEFVKPEQNSRQIEASASEEDYDDIDDDDDDEFGSKHSLDQERMFSAFKRSTNTKYKPNGELKTSTVRCGIVTMLPPVVAENAAVNKHFLQWAETLQRITGCLRKEKNRSHRQDFKTKNIQERNSKMATMKNQNHQSEDYGDDSSIRSSAIHDFALHYGRFKNKNNDHAEDDDVSTNDSAFMSPSHASRVQNSRFPASRHSGRRWSRPPPTSAPRQPPRALTPSPVSPAPPQPDGPLADRSSGRHAFPARSPTRHSTRSPSRRSASPSPVLAPILSAVRTGSPTPARLSAPSPVHRASSTPGRFVGRVPDRPRPTRAVSPVRHRPTSGLEIKGTAPAPVPAPARPTMVGITIPAPTYRRSPVESTPASSADLNAAPSLMEPIIPASTKTTTKTTKAKKSKLKMGGAKVGRESFRPPTNGFPGDIERKGKA